VAADLMEDYSLTSDDLETAVACLQVSRFVQGLPHA